MRFSAPTVFKTVPARLSGLPTPKMEARWRIELPLLVCNQHLSQIEPCHMAESIGLEPNTCQCAIVFPRQAEPCSVCSPMVKEVGFEPTL